MKLIRSVDHIKCSMLYNLSLRIPKSMQTFKVAGRQMHKRISLLKYPFDVALL